MVNLWGGYADQKAKRLWKEDTMPCVYSTTKSASAVVIAHMVDRYEICYNKVYRVFISKPLNCIYMQVYLTTVSVR